MASSGRHKRNLFKYIFATVIIGIVALYFILFAGMAGKDTMICIPSNATAAMVNDSLSKYLGSGYARKTMRLIQISGTDIANRHGAYLIKKGDSPIKAARTLARRAQHPVRITINGFRLRDTLASRVAAKFEFSADEFLAALNDEEFLSSYGHTEDSAIAIFIDNTYEFYWSDSPRKVIDSFQRTYDDFWNKSRKDKAKSLGLKPDEVMTIASIADEETNKNDEKGRIGRLYINRLRRGMKLQADPTVRFALGDFSIRRVTVSHLKANSLYNTYRYSGLPPGPIRTTSAQTVDSILQSAPSNDIFMCAREDFSGYHNFSDSFETHQKNARRYQHWLDSLNIH